MMFCEKLQKSTMCCKKLPESHQDFIDINTSSNKWRMINEACDDDEPLTVTVDKWIIFK